MITEVNAIFWKSPEWAKLCMNLMIAVALRVFVDVVALHGNYRLSCNSLAFTTMRTDTFSAVLYTSNVSVPWKWNWRSFSGASWWANHEAPCLTSINLSPPLWAQLWITGRESIVVAWTSQETLVPKNLPVVPRWFTILWNGREWLWKRKTSLAL